MNTVDVGNLPPGTEVRGVLYDDPNHVYGLGDVLEIELKTGYTIDVGWDDGSEDGPFRIVVYREYFGDRCVDRRVPAINDVVIAVSELARHYATEPQRAAAPPLAGSPSCLETAPSQS
jgi:hypothetical protein